MLPKSGRQKPGRWSPAPTLGLVARREPETPRSYPTAKLRHPWSREAATSAGTHPGRLKHPTAEPRGQLRGNRAKARARRQRQRAKALRSVSFGVGSHAPSRTKTRAKVRFPVEVPSPSHATCHPTHRPLARTGWASFRRFPDSRQHRHARPSRTMREIHAVLGFRSPPPGTSAARRGRAGRSVWSGRGCRGGRRCRNRSSSGSSGRRPGGA